MSDWFSYTLRDALMFGPEVYWRLFALHNQILWPLPGVAMIAGAALVLLMMAPTDWRSRIGLLLTSLAWIGAAHFLWARFSPINWPMAYVTWAFAAQAALLSSFALVSAGGPGGSAAARSAGLLLIVYSVFLHPLVGLLFGRPLAQAEVIGLAPDPTALASLGILLAVCGGRWRAVLSVILALWCVLSAVTLFTLGMAQGWLLISALGVWSTSMLLEIVRARARG